MRAFTSVKKFFTHHSQTFSPMSRRPTKKAASSSSVVQSRIENASSSSNAIGKNNEQHLAGELTLSALLFPLNSFLSCSTFALMVNMRQTTSIAVFIILLASSLGFNFHSKRLGQFKVFADPAQSFDFIEKVLFQKFTSSVLSVMNVTSGTKVSLYSELIYYINSMSFTNTANETQEKSVLILRNLFPWGILPAYKAIFGKFPRFSAWINAQVTAVITTWLMGPSNICDLQLTDGSIAKDSCLKIEKCRFLEHTKCVHTCLYACKVPTQRFFKEEMGLAVALKPNFTDFSCRFDFGVEPIPLELDTSVRVPCIAECPKQRRTAPESVLNNTSFP